MAKEFGTYKINDKRGREQVKEPCRTCGAPDTHTAKYNSPTMGCIQYLRSEIQRLNNLLEAKEGKVT